MSFFVEVLIGSVMISWTVVIHTLGIIYLIRLLTSSSPNEAWQQITIDQFVETARHYQLSRLVNIGGEIAVFVIKRNFLPQHGFCLFKRFGRF